MVDFIPRFGFGYGVWYSIFHSISAFTNAGLTLFANYSFYWAQGSTYLQVVMILLMTIGCIGIIPLIDIITSREKGIKRLELQSKIVIIYSFVLIIVSVLGLKLMESNITWMNALFMGTSVRSAGMYTMFVSQMGNISKVFMLVLMIIGGGCEDEGHAIRSGVYRVLSNALEQFLTKKQICYTMLPTTVVAHYQRGPHDKNDKIDSAKITDYLFPLQRHGMYQTARAAIRRPAAGTEGTEERTQVPRAAARGLREPPEGRQV